MTAEFRKVVDILEVEDIPAIEAGRRIEPVQLGIVGNDVLLVVGVLEINCLRPGVVRIDGEPVAETAGQLYLQAVIGSLGSNLVKLIEL